MIVTLIFQFNIFATKLPVANISCKLDPWFQIYRELEDEGVIYDCKSATNFSGVSYRGSRGMAIHIACSHGIF